MAPGDDTAFVIPLAPALSPAGEAPGVAVPQSGDPVAITIVGEYDLVTQWQATPASGQGSLGLGTDFRSGGWATALDPGRWLIGGGPKAARDTSMRR